MKRSLFAHLIVVLAIACLAGCGNRPLMPAGEASPAQGSANGVLPSQLEVQATTDADTEEFGPPKLEVSVGGETLEALKSSYCWNDSDRGRGVCADAATLADTSLQKVKPVVKAGESFKLNWTRAPDGLQVTMSYPGQEKAGESIKASEDGLFKLASGAGKQLYQVTATWPQGTVPYYFEVTVHSGEDDALLQKLAWDALSEEGQASVIGSWQEAEVAPFDSTGSGLAMPDRHVKEEELQARHLASVTFPTEWDPLVGPIVTVLDKDTLEIVGYMYRM